MEYTSITIHITVFSSALSSTEASLCRREAGRKRKKESAQGTMGRGKGEEKPPRFPSSHRPPRAFYFSIIATFIGIPTGSLCGEERFFCTLSIHHDDHDSWTPKLVNQGVTKTSLPRPRPLPPHL